MRSGLIATAILALVGAGCLDKGKGSGGAESAQPRSEAEAEAEAARASQAKGKVQMSRPGEKIDPAARVELVAPEPLSPSDGSEFNQFPRKTTLTWAPVTGAVSYKLEVEYQSPDGQWLAAVPVKMVKETEYQFDFLGAQPGRWHVWAVDANSHEGPKSNWWTFRYTK
jgi:hypothetical protein